MKTSCPACGAWSSLDVLIGHEGAHKAVAVALSYGPLGKLLIAYVGCFRSPTTRQLPWDKVERLLRELLLAIEQASVERNGRRWPAPAEYWRAGLEMVLQARDTGTLTLPLPNHAYLFEIIARMGNKAEARVETETIKSGGIAPVALPANPGFEVGNQVRVIAGNWKGFTGVILELLPRFALVDQVKTPDGQPSTDFTAPFDFLELITE